MNKNANISDLIEESLCTFNQLFEGGPQRDILLPKFASMLEKKQEITRESYFKQVQDITCEDLQCDKVVKLFEDIWAIESIRNQRKKFILSHWLYYHIQWVRRTQETGADLIPFISDVLDKMEEADKTFEEIAKKVNFNHQQTEKLKSNAKMSHLYEYLVKRLAGSGEMNEEKIKEKHTELIQIMKKMFKIPGVIEFELQKHILVAFEKAYKVNSKVGNKIAKQLIQIKQLVDLVKKNQRLNNKIKSKFDDYLTASDKQKYSILEGIKSELYEIDVYLLNQLIRLSKQNVCKQCHIICPTPIPVCIFNEESINYPVLLEFYLSNKNNPEIVQEIMEKIKAYDRKLHEEIEGLNKYVEDIIFEDDNINYIKLMMSAYEFYSESKFILENRPEKDTLTINDSYFKESLNVFVNNYENFYQKIMEEICKLKYKASIPSKITFLFEGLEVLISKFFPQDYERIKTNICNMSFNDDLSIENPLNEDSKIYTRIQRINNTLKRDLESDCTKVLNIFNPNSKKYYEQLDNEQKKRYVSRLQQEFNKQIKFFYEKAITIGTNEVDQEKIQKILQLIPQQKMLFQLENEFKSIKKKVNADRDSLILNFKREIENREFNFDKMTRIYKQMNRKDQDKCKQELSRSIQMDFKYLEELHIDIEKWSIRYKEMCQKYENNSILIEQSSFFNVYNDARSEFESFISKKIDQLIKLNIDNLFTQLSDSAFNLIKETNLTIIKFYNFSIQEKGNQFFKHLAVKSENQIINLIPQFRFKAVRNQLQP